MVNGTIFMRILALVTCFFAFGAAQSPEPLKIASLITEFELRKLESPQFVGVLKQAALCFIRWSDATTLF
jgi:hypothetical protein